MFKAAVALALVAAVSAIGPTWTEVEDTPVLSHATASRLTLAFTAYFGIDRFYMGYIVVGALKALCLGGGGIWVLIDAIFITHCWLLDNWGRLLEGCNPGQQIGVIRHGRGAEAPAAEEKPAIKEDAEAAAGGEEDAANAW